jgi:hypothetical protein
LLSVSQLSSAFAHPAICTCSSRTSGTTALERMPRRTIYISSYLSLGDRSAPFALGQLLISQEAKFRWVEIIETSRDWRCFCATLCRGNSGPVILRLARRPASRAA